MGRLDGSNAGRPAVASITESMEENNLNKRNKSHLELDNLFISYRCRMSAASRDDDVSAHL